MGWHTPVLCPSSSSSLEPSFFKKKKFDFELIEEKKINFRKIFTVLELMG